MIENIFYDIGNVLLKFNPNLPLELSVTPIDANILLMEQLSTKYKIFAVTDATRELIDFEIKNFDFFNSFQEVITSEESRFAKNDPGIYRFIVTKFNFAPEKCLFIDDKKENILAAKNIGIKTIHYINYDNLIENLINYNIIK
ncbi:MAG: HAD-IA family hydrolase [Rickettsiaceae bacterium]|nr:HAD-IA family hydrolase [Rickettsiaceae bacterium]